MALITLLFRPTKRQHLWILLAAPIPVFLLIKTVAQYPVLGAALPLTITEVGAITATTLLAYFISSGLCEFEEAVAHITIGHNDDTFSGRMQGQAEMYREVRRARRYHRPLSVMAVGVEDRSIQVALDRIMREAHEALIKRHLLSDVARTLCDVLEDYNLVTQQADRFMVMLPEMPPENIDALIDHLRREVAQEVGVDLKFGMARFPDDAVTFESLVDIANREVTTQLKNKVSSSSAADPIPTEPVGRDPLPARNAFGHAPAGSEMQPQ